MRQLITLLGLVVVLGLVQSAPVEVVYTGEGCACPTQLGYQLNVPNPPKPKKYGASDYGYRVEKLVQTKAKISYSFDFTVDSPGHRHRQVSRNPKLYAKVDRVTVNKGGLCRQAYIQLQLLELLQPQTKLQERPPRYVKLYHKDLAAQQQQQQQKLKLFGLMPAESHEPSPKTKRKTKKSPAGWLGLGRRLAKRDIKGEFDLLERERAQIDLTAPEIIHLLSTTSVPDPLEQGSTPLQFAGDLESVTRRGYTSALLGSGGGYPVQHVSDSQLDRLISEIVYPHPHYLESSTHYPEPHQKRQTTDFLKKLIDGRLGGWGFDSATEPDHTLHADYSTTPAKTYGYNSHVQNGYSIDTYNVPPISEYLRAWF
ncbi:GL20314 [Drosophila persimilis]|uniref:GL20314 n=1 Tax=Drosophila persimilis TaxID=7234 RepID=B4GXM1_DROPE|nr:GL20314 [Drosophila persimilis]